MVNFTKPKGTNFSSSEEISVIELSNSLCKIVSFIQNFEPHAKLQRYNDWWEHDGLHFHCGKITFDNLFNIINSPKNLIGSMTGDFNVFVGIAPEDNSWYLRFYLDWDEKDEILVGRFDATFPNEIAEQFENIVLHKFETELKKQESETYYQSIIV